MADIKTFILRISRVDGPLFSDEALSVTVPGVVGEMTILPNHSALISPLKAGTISVKTTGGVESFDIESGTLEVSNNEVTILL